MMVDGRDTAIAVSMPLAEFCRPDSRLQASSGQASISPTAVIRLRNWSAEATLSQESINTHLCPWRPRAGAAAAPSNECAGAISIANAHNIFSTNDDNLGLF